MGMQTVPAADRRSVPGVCDPGHLLESDLEHDRPFIPRRRRASYTVIDAGPEGLSYLVIGARVKGEAG